VRNRKSHIVRAIASAPSEVENVVMKAARFPKLVTPRLLLRAPGERDIPAWFARATDVDSASLAGDPVPDDISSGKRWLARSRQRFADGQAIRWSIDRTGISDAIGTITLSFSATDAKAAALGFVLARAHWGLGLASEAAREVLRCGFETLALEQVEAEAAVRNSASLRIFAKLGFKHIGSFIDEFDGEPCERFVLVVGKWRRGRDSNPDGLLASAL
jgi:ribosomal-protein-alanine N-acetyltransferase